MRWCGEGGEGRWNACGEGESSGDQGVRGGGGRGRGGGRGEGRGGEE